MNEKQELYFFDKYVEVSNGFIWFFKCRKPGHGEFRTFSTFDNLDYSLLQECPKCKVFRTLSVVGDCK